MFSGRTLAVLAFGGGRFPLESLHYFDRVSRLARFFCSYRRPAFEMALPRVRAFLPSCAVRALFPQNHARRRDRSARATVERKKRYETEMAFSLFEM